VIGVDTNLDQPSAHTKYCEKIFCKDVNDENILLATLISISKREKKRPVLFLSTDMSVLIASQNREFLGKYYHFNLPSKSVVRTFMDKALFSDFADQHGHKQPKTFVAGSVEDIEYIANMVPYPCVVKPSFRKPAWDKANPSKLFKASSREELIRLYQQKSPLANDFIVQEYIPGPDRDVYFCLLWYNSLSQPIASFTGRKIMQWEPSFGSTCVAESCSNNDGVISIILSESIRLFDSVSYKGTGSVEFKKDTRDGVLKIVEPTVGRADLQSAIAYHSGINIALLEYCDHLDLKLPRFRKHRRDICWINEENLFWLLGNARKGYPLNDWTRVIRSRKFYAFFDPTDLKPFLGLLRQKVLPVIFRHHKHKCAVLPL
jgi:predicted ATP-grasp superfamily ATP-dependent carboligase